jgi:hypothetical protein
VAAENHKGFDDDSTILRELFSGQGLHSALNHSAIEDASDPAKLDVERQAAKVAQRAAAALRASREAVRKEPVHMCAFKPVFVLCCLAESLLDCVFGGVVQDCLKCYSQLVGGTSCGSFTIDSEQLKQLLL